MKTHPSTVPSLLSVPPPAETFRDGLGDRRAAAHLFDPNLHRQRGAGTPDYRTKIAASGAPQRIRARQTEMRTAQLCHVRVHRRSQAMG
jgi:hypothetical protein